MDDFLSERDGSRLHAGADRNADRLSLAARDAAAARRETAASPALDAAVRAVKRFQADRLARTHADLLQEPRHAAAARFFLDDLYGTKDFTQRDAELARVIPHMTRWLPESALLTVADAVELDALSERLDAAIARRLGAKVAHLDEAAYVRAYSVPEERPLRERQIALVLEIGRSLDRLVKNRLIGGLLAAMRGPARAAGLLEMHEFLVRGFDAFRSMRGSAEFLGRVEARERALMERWFTESKSATR